MALAVLSGFALALAAPGLHRLTRTATGWLLALLPLGLFVYFALQLVALPTRGAFTITHDWVPSLGIQLSFHVDGLSLLFALLISGIGALILIYAGGYLAGHPQLGRLYAYLLMFMASMLGLVLADNVIALFVFWELTSLSSYLLIGFDHEREAARSAALQALLVTGAGGLALLAGLLLLGLVGKSLGLSTLLTQAEVVRSHGLYLPILVLVLIGAFTKSAQFPFHFWLPNAMEAPTPVSAYLHSATMVKAGVYLLARSHPILGGTDAWLWAVTAFGATTMLTGAYLAVRESDFKRLLAYSTVSALGILVFLLGLGSDRAVIAAVVFLLGHALYKGALFLVAGAVDHETGTRDVDQLGGLGRAMPITALAAGMAAISMAGLPPLFGFIAKELVYEAAWHAPAALLLTTVAVLANMLLVAVAALVGLQPFLGNRTVTPKQPHEAPLPLWLGPVLLASLGLVLGWQPRMVSGLLFDPAIAAILQKESAPVELVLWHGWTPVLGLSLLTLAGGAGFYLLRLRLRRGEVTSPLRFGPARGYELALAGLNGLARIQTRIIQSGYLHHYLLTIFLTTVILAGIPLATRFPWLGSMDQPEVHFYEAGLAVLIILAAFATVRARSRLVAIATLGVVGFGVAMIYVLFGAPDLAMTQFLIETLTVILFVLVFYHLPASAPLSDWQTRGRDALIAATVGAMMTALVLMAGHVELAPTISHYYGTEESLRQAHGRNVVNVILVDFRGLDTLGEITVLTAAGIGVYALLKFRPANVGGHWEGGWATPIESDPDNGEQP